MRDEESKDVLVMVNDRLIKAGKVIKKEDGLEFYKKVNREKHFLKKYRGYAIDERVYKKMIEAGVKEFIFDEGTQKLSVDLDTMKKFAILIDLNHGKQVCINDCYATKL